MSSEERIKLLKEKVALLDKQKQLLISLSELSDREGAVARALKQRITELQDSLRSISSSLRNDRPRTVTEVPFPEGRKTNKVEYDTIDRWFFNLLWIVVGLLIASAYHYFKHH